jgi:hypothetical protein
MDNQGAMGVAVLWTVEEFARWMRITEPSRRRASPAD